jgi:hypothetical protein
MIPGDRDAGSSRAGQLAPDQRGAVMLIGLFLALAVIGALWCLIGIGNAIIAREHSQEAVDSAAFTNAVLHARGMNFIAFINIIVMALTMTYLLLTWFDVILSSIMLLTGTWEFGPNWCVWHYATWIVDVDVNYCQYARNVEKIEGPVFRFDRKVFDRLKKVGPPLFEVQVWAATAVPYLGTEAALLTATDYQRPATVSFSLSSFPGGGAIRPLNELHRLDKIPDFDTRDGRNAFQDRRIGLPVEAEPAFQLCERGARFPLEWLKTTVGGNIQLGGRSLADWSGAEPLASLVSAGMRAIGETNHSLFCNEKTTPPPSQPDQCALSTAEDASDSIEQLVQDWRGVLSTGNDALRQVFYFGLMGARGGVNDKFYLKEDQFWSMGWPKRTDTDGFSAGPKLVTPYAFNGNDWMQIWAVSAAPVDSDTLASRIVRIPSRLFGRGREADAQANARGDTPPFRIFLAQAEFYYDCAGVWESSYCNKGGAALYQLRWRARLRRLHGVDVLGDLTQIFFSDFLRGPVGKKINSQLSSRLPPLLGRRVADALSSDLTKLVNDDLFTGEQTSDALLH